MKLYNLHYFKMFEKDFAFDCVSKFVFNVDDLSIKILNSSLESEDYNKYGNKLIKDRISFIELLESKGILTTVTELRPYYSNTGLTAITLFLTNNCNLKCNYCYEHHIKREMSYDIIGKSIDFLYRNSNREKPAISLFGGEPLLEKRLILYIERYINNKYMGKCNYSMTTNGTIMSDEIKSIIDRMDINIMLSLDGSEEKQNKNRKFKDGSNSYDVIKGNIKKYFSNDLNRVTIRNTITKDDVNYYDTYMFFKNKNLKRLMSLPVSTADTTIRLNHQDIDVLIENSKKIAEVALDDIINNEPTLINNLFKYSNMYSKNNTTYCGAGIGSVAVDVDGSTYICHRFVGNKEFSIGNISDEDIDVKLKEKQKILLNRYNKITECKQCWARNLCNGGCMFENYIEGDDINHTNHMLCDLRRAWYEISIAIYAYICENKPEVIKKIYGEDIFTKEINRWLPLNID